MTEYTVSFRTTTAWAMTDIKTRTAKQALKLARALYDADPTALDWYPYEPTCKPLDEIEIADPAGKTVAVWRDGALTQAAYDLLDALEQQTDASQAVMTRGKRGTSPGLSTRLTASFQRPAPPSPRRRGTSHEHTRHHHPGGLRSGNA